MASKNIIIRIKKHHIASLLLFSVMFTCLLGCSSRKDISTPATEIIHEKHDQTSCGGDKCGGHGKHSRCPLCTCGKCK